MVCCVQDSVYNTSSSIFKARIKSTLCLDLQRIAILNMEADLEN